MPIAMSFCHKLDISLEWVELVLDSHPQQCHRLIPQLQGLGGVHVGCVVAQNVVQPEQGMLNLCANTSCKTSVSLTWPGRGVRSG